MANIIVPRTNALQQAAVEYARRGWSVFPLRPGTKEPAIRFWTPCQREAASVERVARFWERNPDANIAIVTGAVSRLVVLDVDGEAGRESLRGRHLPATLVVETGRGWHYYFAHPGCEVRTCKPAPGLDLKAEGGYVVAPPSVHPSGRLYRWAEGLSPADVPVAPLPGWLLEQNQPAGRKRSAEGWRHLVASAVHEGERNTTVASLAGHLLRPGPKDPYVVLDLLLCWNALRCRPPLPDDEVIRTVDSVARLEARRRGVLRGA